MNKAWFNNIGDTEISIITPESWGRPGQIGFTSEALVDQDVVTYNVVWSGGVPTITKKPQAELDAIILERERVRLQGVFKSECTNLILERYPEPIQRSAALGVYPQEFVEEMKNFIANTIEEENRVYDMTVLATTLSELIAITPLWRIP